MDFWDRLVEGFESLAQPLAEWLPRILLALLVLIVGRIILGVVRRLVIRLLESRPAQLVFDRAGMTAALAPSDQTPARLTATVIHAVLLLVLAMIVFDILRAYAIVDLLERLLGWVPVVILAAVVVIVASAVATWVRDLIRPFADARNVAWLPGVVRILITLFGVLAALDILGITFAEDLVKIVVAGAVVAFAISFGVGGIDTAKQWWARYLAPPGGGQRMEVPSAD